jgi:hypothetical protein
MDKRSQNTKAQGSKSRGKGSQKRKKDRIRWGNVLALGAVALIAGVGAFLIFAPDGDEPSIPPPESSDGNGRFISLDFHFPLADLADWAYESRQIEVEDESLMIGGVLSGLLEGPQRLDLAPVFPPWRVMYSIQFVEADNRVDITFYENLHDLLPSERIALLGSLVYTLTGLDFVSDLSFFVMEGEYREPLFPEAYALRNRGNTSLTADIPGPSPEIIILYFPNDQMTGLVAEQRAVYIDELIGYRETFIIEALIHGPVTAGLSPAMSANITFNSVRRYGEVVFVDFTQDFITNFGGGTTAEEMMIFSLVNTLTETPGVNLVQILVDGQHILDDEQSVFHMNLFMPIERNEQLIINN